MASILLLLTLTFLAIFFRQDQKEYPRFSLGLWVSLAWLLSSTTRIVLILFSRGRSHTVFDAPTSSVEGSLEGRMISTALILLAVVLLVKKKDALLSLMRANRGILVLYAYALLSITWSDYAGISLKKFIRLMGYLLVAFLIAIEEDHHKALEHVFRRYVALFLALSLFFIRTNRSIGYLIGVHGEHFISGIATHKNELGIICAFTLTFLLWRTLEKWPEVNYLDRILILINVYLLIRAGSATASVVAILGMALALAVKLVRGNFRHLMILIASFVLVAIPALFILLNSPGGSISGLFLDSVGRDATLTGRIPMWNELIKLGRNDIILGSGYESYWIKNLAEIWQMYSFQPTNAHSGFVDVLLNLGLIGLIIVVTIMMKALFSMGTNANLSKPYGSWVFVTFIMIILGNITESALLNGALGWNLFLAFVVANEKDRREYSHSTPIPESGS